MIVHIRTVMVMVQVHVHGLRGLTYACRHTFNFALLMRILTTINQHEANTNVLYVLTLIIANLRLHNIIIAMITTIATIAITKPPITEKKQSQLNV